VFQIVEEKCGRRRRRSDAEDAEKTRKKGFFEIAGWLLSTKAFKILGCPDFIAAPQPSTEQLCQK
jgi:hypothetical protein